MKELASLFLTEKEKTLLLLAIDSHVRAMMSGGCAPHAVRIFENLEERISTYDAAGAATMVKEYENFVDSDDDAFDEEELKEALDNASDDDVLFLYDACVERLLADDDDTEDQPKPSPWSVQDVPTEVNPNEVAPPPMTDDEVNAYIDRTFGTDAPCDVEPKSATPY